MKKQIARVFGVKLGTTSPPPIPHEGRIRTQVETVPENARAVPAGCWRFMFFPTFVEACSPFRDQYKKMAASVFCFCSFCVVSFVRKAKEKAVKEKAKERVEKVRAKAEKETGSLCER